MEDEPLIAVVGMAAHFPGAQGIDRYWANLRDGVESIRRFTTEELEAAGVDPKLVRNPRYVPANGVLDGMRAFDAGFFGLSPRDAAIMDPQTRHFLECAWHAMEDAGHVPEGFDGNIGVFAGAGATQYFWRNVVRDPELMESVGYFLLRHTGNDKDFVATRASYEFNLTGPSVGVQTACSTSLVAIHYACQSLLSWECDMALAGGVTIEQPHLVGYLYEEGEILSPDGHCRSYDAASKGTVFGSGAGVVALRRLGDALADGDTIHAVVRGSAVNNDGAGKVSYLAPSVDGQAKAVTEAMAVAGVDPDSLGLIEGHGTGTPVGDPIEVSALTQAFRAHTERTGFCALGSVKSNIGHLDTAAGVASFIKAVLAVKHGEIPPTVHFRDPNPLLELDTSPFYVNGERLPWPEEARPRRAGVNSLGVGGTNAHVIVEEPPMPAPAGEARPWQLLPLSARSAAALEDASRQLMEALEGRPDLPLADVSHTLRTGRRRFGWRRTLVSRSAEEAVEQLATGKGTGWVTGQEEAQERQVAFLFAGGGSQYPGMGRELYEAEPVYREIVDRCLAHLRDHEDTDLEPLLFPAPGTEEDAAVRLRAPALALPALFTVQYAQARTWMSWGVRPSALLGHSMGEYTAACVAGVFSLEDALSLVTLRGRLFETLEAGAMTSVQLGEEELRGLLGDDLSVAAVNAPDVVVAAGPVDAVDGLEATLEARGVDFRRIHIDVAAHSAMLEPILERFRSRVASMTLRAPDLPLLSNLTGDRVSDEVVAPDYWVRHLRETVRFSEGVGRILSGSETALLEVGPGRTLATLARMHPSWTPDRPTLSSLPHPGEPQDALAFQLGTLGALWVHGVDPDWAAFDEGRDRRRVSLPGYPFQREDHFVEAPAGGEAQAAVRAAVRSERGQDPLEWLQQRSWRPAPPAAPRTGAAGERVLVLCDPEGPGARLADRLAARGHAVVRVHAGDGWAPTDGGWVVDPHRPEDWGRLVTELVGEGGVPEAVVHAWSLGPAPGDAGLARSFYGPLHLFQAVEGGVPGHAFRFVAATSGVFPGSGPVVPERAALLGPVRVAPRELPGLSARLVAMDGLPTDPAREARALERLVDEVESAATETVVAYRGAERLVEDFSPVDLREAAPVAHRDGGVILVTGGLGGLGLVAARVLARRGPVGLALLGREGLPPRVSWASWRRENPSEEKTHRAMAEIEALESLGARVHVVKADVTDADAVCGAIREVEDVLGPVTGVVHAAGILDDGPLLGRERSRSEAVLGAKVDGVRALDTALAARDLDLFWLFSSVSAVVGAPGQIDYAAANAVLDAWAHDLAERRGAGALALAWGAWRDVGMAAELAGEARYGAAAGQDARALDHPLFDRVRGNGTGETAYGADFGVDRHWMLAEHELRAGGWVLPGSGYVELIRAAVAERDPERPFVLEDLVFLAPFRVGEGEVRELEVRLTEAGDRLRASVQGRRPGGTWLEHATASVGEGRGDDGGGAEGLESVVVRVGEPRAGGPPEHPVMAFGPRWSNVAGMATGPGEALLRQELPEAFLGDLDHTPLHPALLDMATAGATHLVDGIDPSRDFLIPAGYGRLRQHRPLGRTPTSHVRLASVDAAAGLVSFHVTVYDGEGRPAVDVEDFTMIRVEADGLAHDTEDQPDWLRNAIAPEEGEAVMELLLDRSAPPHLLASTRPVTELIEEASATPVRRSHAARPAAPARVLLPKVMEALSAHPSVAEAAALGSPDDESSPRVVAFVRYVPGAHATVSELRRFLRERVGRPWVPQNFVEVVSLPRNSDGAVDVGALRDPFAVVDDFVAPRTATEEAIAGIWAELLGLDRVGIHDNFLDVGGHSLVGIRVLLRIQQATGVRLEANALTMQTLEQLGADIDRARGTGHEDTTDGGSDAEGDGLIARVRKVIGDR
ncbi:MAG TPA: SDR family oxidoreductase [Longimicrobiales bacterium]|nr:SDR family oxidoreductase [Longimicrobiales bacterium]